MSGGPNLKFDIIGDSGPFSQLGKSIGYRLMIDGHQFLIDCGAPVFQLLGADGLGEIEGIIATHAHEDHKRWFTDIALFQKYSTPKDQPVHLFGSRDVINEYRRSSRSALERTLSPDSKQVVDVPFKELVETHRCAPKPRFRISEHNKSDGHWRVVDQNDDVVPPDRAKVVVNPDVSRPRMVFKDPETKHWVEPVNYYSYDDTDFYDESLQNGLTHYSGLHITPIKSTAWHGPITNSLKLQYDNDTVFFSSDTVYNPELWKDLAAPHSPNTDLDAKTYANKHVIEEDINECVDQQWSQQRLRRALNQYDGETPMIHDVSGSHAIVHTSYDQLKNVDNPLLLTHSPDEFTALQPLAHLGKTFEIENQSFYEVTDQGDRFPPEADCYYKRYSRYFVGFKDENGNHRLIESDDGTFELIHRSESVPEDGEVVKPIQLYEDIGGEYYPTLNDEEFEYFVRSDDRVERLIHKENGSEGTVVDGRRGELPLEESVV